MKPRAGNIWLTFPLQKINKSDGCFFPVTSAFHMRPETSVSSHRCLLFLFFRSRLTRRRVTEKKKKRKKRRKKEKGRKGRKKKNSYRKREHLPDESLSCYHSFRPSMVNRGIGRTLKINLSGNRAASTRFVRDFDSVEVERASPRIQSRLKVKIFDQSKFSTSDLFFFIIFFLKLIRLYIEYADYNLFEYVFLFFRG